MQRLVRSHIRVTLLAKGLGCDVHLLMSFCFCWLTSSLMDIMFRLIRFRYTRVPAIALSILDYAIAWYQCYYFLIVEHRLSKLVLKPNCGEELCSSDRVLSVQMKNVYFYIYIQIYFWAIDGRLSNLCIEDTNCNIHTPGFHEQVRYKGFFYK